MVWFDLPLEQLRTYRPSRPAPPGLDAFWDRTLASSRAAGGAVRVERVDVGLRTVTVDDVTFPGFAGDPVRAWWLVPVGVPVLGTVVEHLGYGGGRGLPHERLVWASHGFAQLVVDPRGQGSIWNRGDTSDPHGSGPSAPGMLTRGLDDPDHLYYRRFLTDAVLAVDAVEHLPGASGPVAVVGHSQGGAAALAAAALHPAVAAVSARAPFLCGIARAVTLTTEGPYGELAGWLTVHGTEADDALGVLEHVDLTHLVARITCPARVAVGLGDAVCPPSGIFGAINAFDPAPTVRAWPYDGHAAGGAADDAEAAAWFRTVLDPAGGAP